MRRLAPTLLALAIAALLASCTKSGKPAHDSLADDTATATAAADTTAELVAVVEGLSNPEGVRYDPEQDVYFISNINGGEAGDSNGFISKVGPTGQGIARKFMEGTPAALMHGPRGMFITGDTLWAADAAGVHGFDRHTGAALTFVDFSAFKPGFLNDIAQGPDGALYVTDTFRPRIFRLAGGRVTVAVDSPALCQPNGITWDAARGCFLLASWGPGPSVLAWTPGATSVEAAGPVAGGMFDGIELLGEGRMLVASQADSSLHLLEGSVDRVALRLPGAPADIAVDTKRGHIAVPMEMRHSVEIWRLREGAPAR